MDFSPRQPVDEVTSLTHGERWFLDGFSVLHPPGGVLWRSCNMSRAKALVQALKEQGVSATYTHLVVRAAALALEHCKDSHVLVCGYQRMKPGRIDIGLSVAGQTNYAPVLVIEDAVKKSLPELVSFLKEQVPKTREKETRDLAGMRRTGWLVPLGFLRRAILRLLGRMFWFRRKLVGTFQITVLREVDVVEPILFYSGAALGVGAVADRVIAENGVPVVAPTLMLTMAFDHRTLDGRRTADLLTAICDILEGDTLLAEVQQDVHKTDLLR
ncbi:MAG TPA: 2-oxo acid dehydrogenase subunit E2 [Pseudomonadota bacterium]|nr:2-oxo acid dehydrogenase subunit E2 [Pseudomonadota bacterium]